MFKLILLILEFELIRASSSSKMIQFENVYFFVTIHNSLNGFTCKLELYDFRVRRSKSIRMLYSSLNKMYMHCILSQMLSNEEQT